MLQSATYTNGRDVLSVSVEKIEVLIKSQEILNFPGLVEMEGDMLVLPYGRGRHGGKESRPVAISHDGGQTWADLPPDHPMADNLQNSGIYGYLGDGTFAYIDVFPREAVNWTRAQGQYHRVMAVPDPTFRLRRFSKRGELLEDSSFKVRNLPWERASYENYGTLLELDNGDLLTVLTASVPRSPEEHMLFTNLVVRSSDGGRTFDCVWAFQPELDGKVIGDDGLDEPDVALLPNGDLLCIMRTGGRTAMYQSRSKDGGRTWSTPVSTGWPATKPRLRVLSNGVLACSSGRGVYGHPQVTHAMFSIDGTGEVWEPPFIFHTGPGCSYTWNMERDGKFYVVYSDSSFTKESDAYAMPYQSIKWAVLNVTREPAPEAAAAAAAEAAKA